MGKIKGIHFQPWIGPSYETSKYGKLLLLGESHYFQDKEDNVSNLTSEVVNCHVNGTGKSPFFRKAGYAFNQNDWKDIWHNIAYANLIQFGLLNSKSQPNEKEDLQLILRLKHY